MLVGLAVGIRSAGHVIARIDTASLYTGEVVLTVVVRGALLLGHGSAGAADTVWIARGAARTFARVAALGIETVGTAATWVVRAFIDVDTAMLWISLVARQAHALGRV